MRERLLKALTSSWFLTTFLCACFVGFFGHMSFGCNGWDPRRPFERNNPDVDRALEMIEDGQYENAEEVLTDYLETNVCEKGKIGLPDDLRQKSDGAYDLGLVLFYLAEKYGERFGDEKKLLEKIDAGENLVELDKEFGLRQDEIKCALIVALAIAKDSQVPIDLRARAYYLVGNLHFLQLRYDKAIEGYNEALRLIPGVVEEVGGDSIGRDAAWNRAVALRRLEDMLQDAGADGGEDGGEDGEDGPQPQQPDGDMDGGDGGDGGDPQSPDGDMDGGGLDAGEDGGQDAGDGGNGDSADAGPDGGNQDQDGGDPNDSEPDAGDEEPQPQDGDPSDPRDADPSPAEPKGGPSSPDEGDRVLDRFDDTPTYQQEEAKKRAEARRRTMEDK